MDVADPAANDADIDPIDCVKTEISDTRSENSSSEEAFHGFGEQQIEQKDHAASKDVDIKDEPTDADV